MGLLDYYGKGLILFKENSAIVMLAVLLVGLNLVVLEGFFNGVMAHMDSFSPLVYLGILSLIILILVNIFIGVAVVGMTRNVLLDERVTLKTGWEIGKKYFLKILQLNIMIGAIAMLATLILGIALTLMVTTLYYPNMPYEMICMGGIGLLICIYVLIWVFSIFAPQAVIIGEKGVIKAIKQSIHLVMNNKIKALILLISLILIYSLSFIPVIGGVLNSILEPIFVIYLTIIITLVYLDLTQEKVW